MIFPLKQVRGGISLIEDVPLIFLENSRQLKDYSAKLFPVWFRKVLTKCPGVNERFELLYDTFKKLNSKEQRLLIDAIRQGKKVAYICNDIAQQPTAKTDLSSESLQKSLDEVYRFLFDRTLSTNAFKVATGMSLADHYDKFYTQNTVFTCPFCGLESYSIPERRRADYDHYLPISEYPWLGVNFDNLVPMGDVCNGKKNATNLLYTVKGDKKTRRLVWYPYQTFNYDLTAKVIQKPTINILKPIWQVRMSSPDADTQNRIHTWDKVFGVINAIEVAMARFHRQFIEDFCRKNNLYGKQLKPSNLRQELSDYVDNKVGELYLEPLAVAKNAWAKHYLHRASDPELEIISNEICKLRRRPSPVNFR